MAKKPNEEGRRVQRVEREVHEVVTRFLMGAFKGDLPGIVTVTQLRMASDLKSAKVSVSVLNGEEKDHKMAAKMLQDRAFEMQKYIAENLALRFTPKLHFEADHSLEKVMKIDRILHELAQGKNPKSEDED